MAPPIIARASGRGRRAGSRAARPGAAGLLAEAHELGVVVVVERGVARQAVHRGSAAPGRSPRVERCSSENPGARAAEMAGPPRAVAAQDRRDARRRAGCRRRRRRGASRRRRERSSRRSPDRCPAPPGACVRRASRTLPPSSFDLPAVLRAEEVEEGPQPPRLHAKRPGGAQQRRAGLARRAVERLEGEERPGLAVGRGVRSTFAQAAFWTRMAPTQTSNDVSPATTRRERSARAGVDRRGAGVGVGRPARRAPWPATIAHGRAGARVGS